VQDAMAIGEVRAVPGVGEDERRRSRRYLCNGFAEVLVVHPECLFRGEIRDISQNGCFVISRAHVQLERLAEAEVRFKLNNRQFKVRARVMSVRKGDGVGFEFLGVNRDAELLLNNLITELSRNLG